MKVVIKLPYGVRLSPDKNSVKNLSIIKHLFIFYNSNSI